MRTQSTVIVCMLLVGTLWAVPNAHAALLDGKTVSFTYLFPDIDTISGSPADGLYLVGPGVEILNGFCCGFEGTLDFSDTNLLAAFHDQAFYTPTGGFNGFRISDVFGSIDPITSVTVNALTDLPGFDASRVSFDENNIWVNWQALFAEALVSGRFRVVSLDINTVSVPEPGILTLVGMGLLAAAHSQRRVRQRRS